MLTIQPGLANTINRTPAFGRGELQRYAEDTDYEEIYDIPRNEHSDYFDYEKEKDSAKQELDLWEQTKANVDSIAKATNSVPIVKNSTKILSGLTMVAIGWGGLRWGTVGTLEVLSKIMDTKAAKSVKSFAGKAGSFISEKTGSLKNALKGTDTYKTIGQKAENLKASFFDTSVGQKLTSIKTAITANSLYKDTVNLKNKSVDFAKNLNYQRVFVETMGVAGGGTAAINALGGKAIDGTKQNVELDEEGNYLIDGEYYDEA